MSLGATLRRAGRVSGKLADRPYITMFDDITVGLMPLRADYAYAGYVGGWWPTFAELLRKFAGHDLLSIAINSHENAMCLDIEKGDASIADAPGWYERQVALGVWRPALYTSASNLAALERTMAAHRIERRAYRLWSAHYTGRAHLCSPRSCGFGLSEADGCQFTSNALGLNLDESILLPDFFEPRPPAPKPVPAPEHSWLEAVLKALPTLKQGDKDETGKPPWVRLMQGDIKALGHAYGIESARDLNPDGDFGIHTANALLDVQKHFGLTPDRVCGPLTWSALITGER